MKTKQDKQKKTRKQLEQKGWIFKRKSTHAVSACQLRLTVLDGYEYSYPYMQEVWCDLCVALGLMENYDLHPRTTEDMLPDGKDRWSLLAVDTVKGVKFYEHRLSQYRIDYNKKGK